ncbi:MAG: M14 family metallopeptidase [Planctomycetota bacterium]|jgi:hypothetical protein|nr:M14 family metallopeptidase [Planctomycetota bacterium]
MNILRSAIWIAVLLSTSTTCFAQATPSHTHLPYNRYHRFDELESTLKRWCVQYPHLIRIRSLARTREGRDLWLVTLGIQSSTVKSLTESKQYAFLGEQRIQFRSRPAVYIDGNHHGNEVASGEVPLYLIDYLLKNYTRYRTVHRLLNTRTLYIIPRVNPDAAEWYFRGVAIRGSVRSDDNDGDGRFDEDPPDDLDGDGLILRMRLPGSRETFPEGLDDDGDGRFNEDAPGSGIDLNRDYPDMSGSNAEAQRLLCPETRAVHDFLLQHREISEVQSFHTYGGILFRPFGSAPDSLIPTEDMAIYDMLGDAFFRYTGNRPTGRPYGPGGNIQGSLLDWVYGRFGTYAVTPELWRIPGEDTRNRFSYFGGLEGIVGPVAEARWRRFNRDVLQGRAFRPWTPFDHPTLGRIEIGGWSPFFRRNPPPEYLEDVCHRATLFSVYQSFCTPHLVLQSFLELKSTPSHRRFRLVIQNEGTFPTDSRWTRDHKMATPVICRLNGNDHVQTFQTPYLSGQQSWPIEIEIPVDSKEIWTLEWFHPKGGGKRFQFRICTSAPIHKPFDKPSGRK